MNKALIVNINFDGIKLIGPSACVQTFDKFTYESFPAHYCGAGKGLGEVIVPDYIFGPTRYLKAIGLDISIKISPACFIHDTDWDLAAPTWKDFYDANRRFHDNLETIIKRKARNDFVKARAMYRPVTYSTAVDTAGKYIFWTMKYNRKHDIPKTAMQYVMGLEK